MRNYLMATAAAAALLVAQPAYAEIITVDFTANIASDPEAIDWPTEGVALSGTYTFDSETVGTPIPDGVQYQLLSYTIKLVGPTETVSSPLPLNLGGIRVYNDLPTGSPGMVRDRYHLEGTFMPFSSGLPFEGMTVRDFGFILTSTVSGSNPALDSTDLPLGNDDLGFTIPGGTAFVRYYDTNGLFRAAGGPVTSITFSGEEDPILATSCEGFKFPFAKQVTLPRKFKLPILLRASLLDEDGIELGPETVAAPVVTVSYNGTFQGSADPNDLVASVLRPTEGNAFVWHDASTTRTKLDESEWAYALDTRPFSQPGVYTVSVMPGDDSYAIIPTCSGTFVRK
jgi:hypothetical protein